MNKKLFLLILLLLTNQLLYSQTTTSKLYSEKPRFYGVSFGVNSSDFYRNSSEKFQEPLKKPHLGFNAGLILDIVNLKRIGSQIELKYTQKGATETFNNIKESEYVIASSKLSYLQVELIPIIIKPLGLDKFNPYISFGGYYSHLIKSKFAYQFDNVFDKNLGQSQELSIENITKKDVGLCINAGIKFSFFSMEYRHEFGLNEIIPTSNIKNQLNSLTLKFSK